MSLAPQIIDQRGSGIVARHSDTFANELRLGADEQKRCPIAFLFLVARLMGRYLLEELQTGLDGLDHRNFEQARKLVERKPDTYLSRAEREIGEALGPLFSGRERTLQRLSATFRRVDLVDMPSEAEK